MSECSEDCSCSRRAREAVAARNRADAWADGRLTHTEECQIHKTPPSGWPFGGFSCNCGGVEVER